VRCRLRSLHPSS